MRNNKNGFTLVELLAVIVILAVVMLIGVTAVGPLMTKSRKNALLTEGTTIMTAAKTAYEMVALSDSGKFGHSGSYCVSVADLRTVGLFDKDDDNYVGSVSFSIDESGKMSGVTYDLTNGTYGIKGGSASSTADSVKEATVNKDNNTVSIPKDSGSVNLTLSCSGTGAIGISDLRK